MRQKFLSSHECEVCRISLKVTTSNFSEFQLTWYESIFFDVCPLCQTLPEGAALIADDRMTRENPGPKTMKRLLRILF